jgi:MFS family permease
MVALFFYLLALICWLGGMIAFVLFTAVLFSRLPVADAGKVVSAIFPYYYITGYVAGAIGLVLAIYFAVGGRGRGWWICSALLLAGALALTVYAGAVVRPKIEAVRGVNEETTPDPARKAQFDSLHRLSVQINGGVIVLDLLTLLVTAAALTA